MTTENQSNPSAETQENHHEHHNGCCAPAEPMLRDPLKVGRNDPCLCGSGKKFKKCCISH